MKKKYCLSFNDPSIYREAIYKKLDANFNCDWYFDEMISHLKGFDIKQLKSVYELKRYNIGPFYWVRGLISLLWKNYDVYLMRGATRNLSSLFFLILKKIFFPKKKVYLWTHGFYGKEGMLEKLLWKKPLFRLADKNFCYGNFARENMIKEGFSPERLFVIYNSLNYDIQLSIRKNIHKSNIYINHFKNSSPVIVMIGRLNLRKKLDLLIEAVYKLKYSGEKYNLILIGDGEDKDKLYSLCNSLGIIDQVWFYGECYDEKENATLIFNADACVVPGDIGLTAIHAMMFGCPCITHDKFTNQGPEFEAIKPGETGDFYKFGSIESLVKTIHNWFDENLNNREIIRRNCFREIDNYWNPNKQIEIFKQHL